MYVRDVGGPTHNKLRGREGALSAMGRATIRSPSSQPCEYKPLTTHHQRTNPAPWLVLLLAHRGSRNYHVGRSGTSLGHTQQYSGFLTSTNQDITVWLLWSDGNRYFLVRFDHCVQYALAGNRTLDLPLGSPWLCTLDHCLLETILCWASNKISNPNS